MTNPYEPPRRSANPILSRKGSRLGDFITLSVALGTLAMQPVLYNVRIPMMFSSMREATILLSYLPLILLAIYLGWRAIGRRTIDSISNYRDNL